MFMYNVGTLLIQKYMLSYIMYLLDAKLCKKIANTFFIFKSEPL